MDLFHRLFNFIGVSLFSGATVGFVSGLIGSSMFWVITTSYLPELYSDYSLSHLVFNDALFLGVALGLLISCATGIHHALLGRNSIRLVLWTTISGLGTVSGIYFSRFTANNFLIFLISITFIGTSVGLVTHWLINKIPDIDEPATWLEPFSILNLVIAFLFTFLPIYGYFRLLTIRMPY